MEKILTFDENVLMKDYQNSNGLKGKVVLKDSSGSVIFTKWNLIVLRGRVLALENLFGIQNTLNTYGNTTGRKILTFGIGTGGAQVISPFSVNNPASTDVALTTPVPFLTINSTSPVGIDYPIDANTSTFAAFETGEAAFYPGGGTTITSTIKQYYYKTFTTPTLEIDESNNEAYVKATLTIGTRDARGRNINEMGLFFMTPSSYLEPELFSRITFNTESLASITKELTVEYYIYA